jgi:hypothetical protein
MAQRLIARIGSGFWLALVSIGIGVAGIAGCAADSPKPSTTMTPDQVKRNADKSFERLQQEEKNRTIGSGAAPY